MLEEFLKGYESVETRKAYKSRISKFLSWLEKERQKDFRDVVLLDIVDYVSNYKHKYTSVIMISTIKTYYKYCFKEDLKIEVPSVSTYRPDRNLSFYEVQLLVKQADKLRDKLIIKTAVETGLRVNELANLSKEKILKIDSVYYLSFTAKGSKQRLVKISSELAKMLLLLDNTKNNTLFGIGARQIERIIKDLGEKNLSRVITPHMFRHCFATELMNQEVGFSFIQAALGHENIATTLKYLHNKRDKDQWEINLNL